MTGRGLIFLATFFLEKAKNLKICLSFGGSMPKAQIKQCPPIPPPHYTGFGLSKSQGTSTLHFWFKCQCGFCEMVDLSYWWSFIGKGLLLQPAHQGCFYIKVCTGIRCVKITVLNWTSKWVVYFVSPQVVLLETVMATAPLAFLFFICW